ncbi:hypothetical protein CCZ01_02475 [Helicobacter monodelphidis]|uniref:DUF1104 domain-containing protein n=1 Tax=Helicobacter sp. 15-1451 TaxID=2004995 RepID=UPI000DCDBEB7|nr:DUF1104 domain-containing protein [Helicobacter sp. 15-1451]RAX58666.1 hypothetical protein CCZ01_02475 [Helicobacter sp. 15-1451]
MKTISLICASAILCTGIVAAADFSKTSLADLQNMSGKVKPQDALDYRMELHKRMEEMTVKEAREFRQQLREKARANHDKMTKAELQKYREDVRTQMQTQLDSMLVKDARAKGVLKYGMMGGKMHGKHPKKGGPHNRHHDM